MKNLKNWYFKQIFNSIYYKATKYYLLTNFNLFMMHNSQTYTNILIELVDNINELI